MYSVGQNTQTKVYISVPLHIKLHVCKLIESYPAVG